MDKYLVTWLQWRERGGFPPFCIFSPSMLEQSVRFYYTATVVQCLCIFLRNSVQTRPYQENTIPNRFPSRAVTKGYLYPNSLSRPIASVFKFCFPWTDSHINSLLRKRLFTWSSISTPENTKENLSHFTASCLLLFLNTGSGKQWKGCERTWQTWAGAPAHHRPHCWGNSWTDLASFPQLQGKDEGNSKRYGEFPSRVWRWMPMSCGDPFATYAGPITVHLKWTECHVLFYLN